MAGRKPLVIAIGALAAVALVARKRRARPVVAAPSQSNGSAGDSRESLRRFVEAGERLHGAGPASPER
jgi:hypothetical protein